MALLLLLLLLLTNLADHLADLFLVRGLVTRIVDIKTEACALRDDGFAQPVALLADAAREDEGVDVALEGDVVGAYEAADAVDEEVEGEFVLLVVLLVLVRGGGGDGAEIGGSGQGFPPGLFVQDGLCHGDVKVLG